LQAGGTGLTLSGGTTVTAADSLIASNATVSVPCGTMITTATLDYNSVAVPSQPCSGIRPPRGTSSVNIVKVATVNPLAGIAAVSISYRFTTVAPVLLTSLTNGFTVPASACFANNS
jgi:hypothetical protein